MKYGFGVDVGGTTVKIALFDETGNLLDKWEIPSVTENEGAAILPDTAASIKEYMRVHGLEAQNIIGVGVGVPGPVDDVGVVNECQNLNWGVFNVRQALEALIQLPVRVGNDANVAALGECWKGGGGGCANLVMATFGTGVGGGIIIDGKPINGAHGAAGEIGHMVLDARETEYCNCGKRGCTEQYCSATGVARLAKRYLAAQDKPSTLRNLEKITAKDVFDAANAGDEAAKEILEQVYDYMGQFLGTMCAVIDPEVVVMGGGMSRAGQQLVDGAARYFPRYAFPATKSVRFTLATLGNDAGAVGAFKLVLDAFS